MHVTGSSLEKIIFDITKDRKKCNLDNQKTLYGQTVYTKPVIWKKFETLIYLVFPRDVYHDNQIERW